jgi:hypothetical protein
MQKNHAQTEKHKSQVASAKTLAASSTALFPFFSFGLPCLYNIAKKNEIRK